MATAQYGQVGVAGEFTSFEWCNNSITSSAKLVQRTLFERGRSQEDIGRVGQECRRGAVVRGAVPAANSADPATVAVGTLARRCEYHRRAMCVACFTTAQLATVGAVSARWWFVNKWRSDHDDAPHDDDEQHDHNQRADEEPVPVA